MALVNSRLSALALAAALGLSGLSTVGCSKKDDKKAEASAKSEKDKKADDDDDGAGKKPSKKHKSAKKAEDDAAGSYAHGDVLKHVPKDCKVARLYVDVQALQKNDAFATNVDSLEEKLVSSMKDDDADKGRKVLKALKKAGIDPSKDVRELAMCGDAKNDFVLAIGGDFAGKKPLDAISKAIEASGDDAPKHTTSDDVDLLVLKGKKKAEESYLGEVAPGVLVVADDKDSVSALKAEKDRSTDWNVAKDRLAVFDYREKGRMGFDLTLTSAEDAVLGKFVGTFEDSTGAKMKADPKAFETQFGKMAGQLSKKIEETPFKAIAPDVKATKIAVDGNVVTVTITVANDHLGSAIKAIAAAKPDELAKAFQ